MEPADSLQRWPDVRTRCYRGRRIQRLFAGLIATLAMTGTGIAADLATFEAKSWGLRVLYPAGLSVSSTFRPNAFDRGAWRVSYAITVGAGTPIVAFALPDIVTEDAGGRSEAAAELRIGASRDPTALATCLTYGMNSGDNVEAGTRLISGIAFTDIPDNGDGGSSQRIETDDFRAIHDGTCWAIDLVRFFGGTSNRKPAYTLADIDSLRGILDSIVIK